MQTSLETLGELERRLTMSVPVADIESEIQQRLARLAKNVKVPGFRPGKVPLKMVAQQYGPQVRSDVISDSVKNTFADAIRDQNLRIAGNPRIEPKAEAALPTSSNFRRPSRSIRTSRSATFRASRSSARRRKSARKISSAPSRCCAASAHATNGFRAPRR